MTAIDNKPSAKIRDALIVILAMAVISYLHYRPLHIEFMEHHTFHILLRRLYYIPILYAAIRFGIRGGLLTSLSATVIFAPHAAISMGGFFGNYSIDNFFDLVLYNVVGFTTGMVVESRQRQAQRYQEVLGLNREIEDRETALRHMQAYTGSILTSISSGVISADRRSVVVTANPAAAVILGRAEEELVAFPLAKVFAGHDELSRAAELVLSGWQGRATLETEFSRGEEGKVAVAVRITPHRSRGDTVGVVITLEDLTEVKNLTEQLLRADRLAGLGELVAGMAHEVRNPLGVIKASVQMLEQEMDADGGAAELTRVMAQEIDRLDALVNALLDFGRPSESQFGDVDPGRVLDEVVLLTRQYAGQQQVAVSTNYAEDLPAIWADEDRLKQVFVNLISNAIQAMPGGGGLTLSAATEDGFLRISLADTGMGVAAEVKERIFDPFYTTRAEGSGLGLAIVHRIIDAHNGYITVESKVGAGSTFTVGLPLAAVRTTVREREDA